MQSVDSCGTYPHVGFFVGLGNRWKFLGQAIGDLGHIGSSYVTESLDFCVLNSA